MAPKKRPNQAPKQPFTPDQTLEGLKKSTAASRAKLREDAKKERARIRKARQQDKLRARKAAGAANEKLPQDPNLEVVYSTKNFALGSWEVPKKAKEVKALDKFEDMTLWGGADAHWFKNKKYTTKFYKKMAAVAAKYKELRDKGTIETNLNGVESGFVNELIDKFAAIHNSTEKGRFKHSKWINSFEGMKEDLIFGPKGAYNTLMAFGRALSKNKKGELRNITPKDFVKVDPSPYPKIRKIQLLMDYAKKHGAYRNHGLEAREITPEMQKRRAMLKKAAKERAEFKKASEKMREPLNKYISKELLPRLKDAVKKYPWMQVKQVPNSTKVVIYDSRKGEYSPQRAVDYRIVAIVGIRGGTRGKEMSLRVEANDFAAKVYNMKPAKKTGDGLSSAIDHASSIEMAEKGAKYVQENIAKYLKATEKREKLETAKWLKDLDKFVMQDAVLEMRAKEPKIYPHSLEDADYIQGKGYMFEFIKTEGSKRDTKILIAEVDPYNKELVIRAATRKNGGAVHLAQHLGKMKVNMKSPADLVKKLRDFGKKAETLKTEKVPQKDLSDALKPSPERIKLTSMAVRAVQYYKKFGIKLSKDNQEILGAFNGKEYTLVFLDLGLNSKEYVISAYSSSGDKTITTDKPKVAQKAIFNFIYEFLKNPKAIKNTYERQEMQASITTFSLRRNVLGKMKQIPGVTAKLFQEDGILIFDKSGLQIASITVDPKGERGKYSVNGKGSLNIDEVVKEIKNIANQGKKKTPQAIKKRESAAEKAAKNVKRSVEAQAHTAELYVETLKGKVAHNLSALISANQAAAKLHTRVKPRKHTLHIQNDASAVAAVVGVSVDKNGNSLYYVNDMESGKRTTFRTPEALTIGFLDTLNSITKKGKVEAKRLTKLEEKAAKERAKAKKAEKAKSASAEAKLKKIEDHLKKEEARQAAIAAEIAAEEKADSQPGGIDYLLAQARKKLKGED